MVRKQGQGQGPKGYPLQRDQLGQRPKGKKQHCVCNGTQVLTGMWTGAAGGEGSGRSELLLALTYLRSYRCWEPLKYLGGAWEFTLAWYRRVEGCGLEEGRQIVRLLWIQEIFKQASCVRVGGWWASGRPASKRALCWSDQVGCTGRGGFHLEPVWPWALATGEH